MKTACTIHLYPTRGHDEMDIDYGIINNKVKELNDLGVDITLQEIGDIIESKFMGKPETADVRRKEDGSLLHPTYCMIRYHSI